MRSVSSFLLLENLMYVVPSTLPSLKSLAQRLFHPVVPLMEEDCETTIGLTQGVRAITSTLWTPIPGVNRFPYQYMINLDGTTISPSQLLALTSAGVDITKVRHPSTCVSRGGICRKCYYAGLLLSTSDYTYDGSLVYNYYDVPPAMTAVAIPPVGSKVPLYVGIGEVKPFAQPSERAVFSYMAGTYTGAILGVSAFDTFPLPLKPSLLSLSINKNLLDRALGELASLKDIPGTYLRFVEGIEDYFEKAASVITLYALSGINGEVSFPESFPRSAPIGLNPV